LHVLIRLNDGWTAGRIVSLTRVARASGVPSPDGDAPQLETLGADGRVLTNVRVPVYRFTDDDAPERKGDHRAGLINIAIPIDETVRGIRVVYAGRTVVERMAGSAQPMLRPAPRPVTAPAPSATARGASAERSIVLTWEGQHGAGAALTYTVQLSSDNGSTWHTVAARLTEPRLVITPQSLPGGSRTAFQSGKPLKYKVLASDGFQSTELTGDLQ
jgi:hypothetical protein